MNGMTDLHLTYALLGLVVFETIAFIYFVRLMFGVLSAEIAKANRRAESVMDRYMATDLTDYTNSVIRQGVLEQTTEEPNSLKVPVDAGGTSYTGGMFE